MPNTVQSALSIALQDQRERWDSGERPPLEEYFAALHDFELEREELVDLVYQEVLLRELRGERPTLDEYRSRFPDLTSELSTQFEVHAGLASVADESASFTADDSNDVDPADEVDQEPRAVDESGAPSHPDQIDGYPIRRQLGRGGFGVVYEAWDPNLQRLVALKLLSSRESTSAERNALLAEAQAVARLTHPNIVPVLAVGEANGATYMTLERMEGGTLADLLQGRPQPSRESAAFLTSIARAVHYAHLCGVLHCDLKPSNILLRANEGAATPPPLADVSGKLCDFGLARQLDEVPLTRGRLAGTLCYLSPERLLRGEPPTVATDIYALGCILYEMLTGTAPYAANSHFRVLVNVKGARLAPPRQLAPGIPGDLEAICLKCLAAAPADRYQTAEDLAADLERFLGGYVPRAVRSSPWKQTARWMRRNPLAAGLALAMLGLVVASFSVVTANMLRAQQAETNERNRADELEKTLYVNQILATRHALASSDLLTAIQILESCTPSRRGFEWYFLWNQCHAGDERLEAGEIVGVTFLTINPSGQNLAVAAATDAVELRDLRTGKSVRKIEPPHGRLKEPVFSPDGKWLATMEFADDGWFVLLWDAATGAGPSKRIGPLGGNGLSMMFLNGGKELFTAAHDIRFNFIRPTGQPLRFETWDVATGKRLTEVVGPETNQNFSIIEGQCSSDGRWLAWTLSLWGLASRDGGQVVRLVDCRTGESTHLLQSDASPVHGTRFSPDGETLATFGESHRVQLWNVKTGELLHSLTGHQDSVSEAAFSPDGRLLATAGADTSVRVWEVSTGKEVENYAGHLQHVSGLAFAAEGSLYSADSSGEIMHWAGQRDTAVTWNAGGAVFEMATSADGRVLGSTFIDGDFRVQALPGVGEWQSASQLAPPVVRPSDDHDWIYLAAEPAAEKIILGDAQGRLWAGTLAQNLQDVHLLNEIPQLRTDYERGPIPPRMGAGKLPAVAADGKNILLIDVATERVIAKWEAADGPVHTVAISRDGKLIAIGRKEKQVELLVAETGARVASFQTEVEPRQIHFQPGGRSLAIEGGDMRSIEVWTPGGAESNEYRRQFILGAGRAALTCMCYTADGTKIVAGATDGQVRIFDLETGRELLMLSGANKPLAEVTINAEGTRIIAATGQDPLRAEYILWDAARGPDTPSP